MSDEKKTLVSLAEALHGARALIPRLYRAIEREFTEELEVVAFVMALQVVASEQFTGGPYGYTGERPLADKELYELSTQIASLDGVALREAIERIQLGRAQRAPSGPETDLEKIPPPSSGTVH